MLALLHFVSRMQSIRSSADGAIDERFEEGRTRPHEAEEDAIFSQIANAAFPGSRNGRKDRPFGVFFSLRDLWPHADAISRTFLAGGVC